MGLTLMLLKRVSLINFQLFLVYVEDVPYYRSEVKFYDKVMDETSPYRTIIVLRILLKLFKKQVRIFKF